VRIADMVFQNRGQKSRSSRGEMQFSGRGIASWLTAVRPSVVCAAQA